MKKDILERADVFGGGSSSSLNAPGVALQLLFRLSAPPRDISEDLYFRSLNSLGPIKS